MRRDKDPKKRHSRIRGRKLPKGAKTKGIISDQEANECSICLVDFEAGQKVGLLPCCHRFHAECVMDWLQVRKGVVFKVTHNTCSLHLATHFENQTSHMGMFYMVY